MRRSPLADPIAATRSLAWVALLLLPAGAGAQAPTICQSKPCIQVGSFNIEHLGSPARPRTPAEVDRLADLLAVTLDLEAFALQEIDTASADWARLKSRLAGHGYRFHEGTTGVSGERRQMVVLAWDGDEVQLVGGSAQELAIAGSFQDPTRPTCKVDGLRVPIAARLAAGQLDFWLVGVHLKSRRRVSGAPSTCSSWIREQQATLLVAELDRLAEQSGEADFLVVGDFNEQADDPSLRSLRMASYTSQMSYRLAGSGTCSYLPGCPDDLIDHVMIYLGETRELARRSGFVYVPLDVESFIATQSDHAPVWASFRTDQDLD